MTKAIPGPDPAPIKPRFVLPPDACDAHCHVFGPATVFPYAPDRAYTPPDAPVEALIRLHDHLGITRAVIVHASCHGSDMRATLDAIARYPARFRGTSIVDPGYDDRDFERLHAGGIRGVRFNFVRHLGGRPDMAFFQRTVARVAPLGWHLILHMDAEDIVEFKPMFAALPLPFVIDHMGRVRAADGVQQEPFRILLEFMKDEKAWVKICGAERVSSMGPPFTDSAPFARALIEAAPDRVLWGTDWPHPNVGKHMPNDGALVDLIPALIPDPALQGKILVDNPARLYGFG